MDATWADWSHRLVLICVFLPSLRQQCGKETRDFHQGPTVLMPYYDIVRRYGTVRSTVIVRSRARLYIIQKPERRAVPVRILTVLHMGDITMSHTSMSHTFIVVLVSSLVVD